jgi:hypothetical protein
VADQDASPLSDYERAEEIEWGTYVAAVAIVIDGVRAFNPGDAVPATHVARGVVKPDEVRLADAPVAEPEVIMIEPPRGTVDVPSDADIAAAAAANRAAGIGEVE